MTAVAHAARVETHQLRTDLEKQQAFVADITEGRAQQEAITAAAPNPEGTTRCEFSRLPYARSPEEDHRNAWSAASSRSDTSIAIVVGGKMEDTRETKETGQTHGMHGTAAQQSHSALRLAEAEERAASTERALAQARDTSKTAIEHFALLGRQLELARTAEKAEAEGRRKAQARIVELERDIDLSGQEQERIRKRAESRLESLTTAFEQEELEAGGKVPQQNAIGGLNFLLVICLLFLPEGQC